MNTAKEQIAVSQELRTKSLLLMKECFDNAKSIANNVDEAFVKKLADTLLLNVLLFFFLLNYFISYFFFFYFNIYKFCICLLK